MAWRGMMVQFKDVGLGRGQAWVALLEREVGVGVGGGGGGETKRERGTEREKEMGRENPLRLHPRHTAELAADPQRPEWAALTKADYVWACMCAYGVDSGEHRLEHTHIRNV